jgi:hypothetical protein
MRSLLILRSPAHGTGWQEQWAFSGTDDRILRDHLARLRAFEVDAPDESWDLKHGHRFQGNRWVAAMLLHPDESSDDPLLPPPAEAAWSAEGALRLADLLPDRCADLRAAIYARFRVRSDDS